MTTLTLTRKTSNRTCTMGVLTCDKLDNYLYTIEGPLPANFENYKHSLLPPGEYSGLVSNEVFQIDGMMIETPCIIMNNVAWFPKASILPAVSNTPRSGQIFVSHVMVDDYNLDCSRSASLAYLAFCDELSRVCDGYFTLRIVEEHDEMTFSELSEQEAKRLDIEREIEEKKNALLEEIKNFDFRDLKVGSINYHLS